MKEKDTERLFISVLKTPDTSKSRKTFRKRKNLTPSNKKQSRKREGKGTQRKDKHKEKKLDLRARKTYRGDDKG